jgi:hypothetical protein
MTYVFQNILLWEYKFCYSAPNERNEKLKIFIQESYFLCTIPEKPFIYSKNMYAVSK